MQDARRTNSDYALAYQQAEERVKARLGFYWHLAAYISVNGFLIVIYLFSNPIVGAALGYPWFIWPLAGWGIGLAFHFLGTFVFQDTPAQRQYKIQQELKKLGIEVIREPQPKPRPTQDYQPSHPFQTPPVETTHIPRKTEYEDSVGYPFP